MKKKEYVDEENQHQKINDEKQIRKKEEPKIIYFIKKYKIYIWRLRNVILLAVVDWIE